MAKVQINDVLMPSINHSIPLQLRQNQKDQVPFLVQDDPRQES